VYIIFYDRLSDYWILATAELAGMIFGMFGALRSMYSFLFGYVHSLQAAKNLKNSK